MILMKQILTKSVVGVDQKILKKPEVKGYPNAIFSLDAYLEERVFNPKLIAPR